MDSMREDSTDGLAKGLQDVQETDERKLMESENEPTSKETQKPDQDKADTPNKETLVVDDKEEEEKKDPSPKKSSERLDSIEKEASQIIGLEEEEKKAESNESETWKNGEKDDKNSQADDIEETISAKKAAMKRTSKVHTTEEVKQHQRHEHGSLDPLTKFDSFEELMNEDKSQTRNMSNREFVEFGLRNLIDFKKKYNFNTTFVDDLIRGIDPKEIMGEDFRLYTFDPKNEGEENGSDELNKVDEDDYLTYESVILLNFEGVNEGEEKQLYSQLSTKTYAADSCYPLKVEKNKYSDLSRFRVIPQLKYDNHLELIEVLKDPKPDTDLNNYYDHFYQEGESNIEKQKERQGKPVFFGQEIQLFHEGTGRYLYVIPVNKSYSDENKSKEHMTYKLGFSRHPNRFTHFKFESLYNTNMVYENKKIADLDKVYLSFADKLIKYHLISGKEEFLFKVGEKQDLTLRKFKGKKGSSLNEIQEEVKYVYIRSGQGTDFLIPQFDNMFNHHKLKYIRVDQLLETSSLQYELVWKCYLNDDDKATFIHCKTGVVLDFGKDLPAPIPSTHQRENTELLTQILNGEHAFSIHPLKHNETVHNILIKGADFRLQTTKGDSTSTVTSYRDTTVDESDKNKREGEARFVCPPLLKDQDFIDKSYDIVGSDNIRFTLNAT